LPPSLSRRSLFAGAAGALAAPGQGRAASDRLTISSDHGTIDFAIGDSRVFRTTGGFKKWQGTVRVDDADVGKSSVKVTIDTRSIEMLDPQQTAMLRGADFFDVEKFPQMVFTSTKVERTGETTLKVVGDLLLRGISHPMTLDVSVTDRNPDAPPGKRYAIFKAEGSMKRSEYGMTKYIDVVGDTVDITIRTDALR